MVKRIRFWLKRVFAPSLFSRGDIFEGRASGDICCFRCMRSLEFGVEWTQTVYCYHTDNHYVGSAQCKQCGAAAKWDTTDGRRF